METIVIWLAANPYVIAFILGIIAGIFIGKRF